MIRRWKNMKNTNMKDGNKEKITKDIYKNAEKKYKIKVRKDGKKKNS